MFVQITFLGVFVSATEQRALEWFFFCVNSEMIEQIMPFLEKFSTIIKVARKKLGPPIGFQIEVLVVSVVCGAWDMHIFMEKLATNFVSFQYFYLRALL